LLPTANGILATLKILAPKVRAINAAKPKTYLFVRNCPCMAVNGMPMPPNPFAITSGRVKRSICVGPIRTKRGV
jgi:hypothetical protein